MAGAEAGMSDSVPDRQQADPTAPHPTQALDDVVHHRTRLGILAVLREVDQAEFGYLRDALGLTDGNLSRHLRTLEAAGHIQVRKGYQGKRPRTWLHLTTHGTKALDQELAALRALVTRLDRTQPPRQAQPHRPQPTQT
jgi:DNA-binding MarR family transcriptional regulator